MHDDYREKLRRQAPSYLSFFQSLTYRQQEEIWGLLPRGTQKTIEILESLEGASYTYAELGETHQQTPTSISQKLNALAEGGFPLELGPDHASCPVLSPNGGRPKAVARTTKTRDKLG